MMKAWQINDHEWYAAETLDQAIEMATADSGLPKEKVFDTSCGGFAPDDMTVWLDGSKKETITAKEFVARMSGPGFAFRLDD